MYWIGIVVIFAVIGFFIYRLDKKLKHKFEDKFNPAEWDLAGVSVDETPSFTAPPAALFKTKTTDTAITAEFAVASNIAFAKKEVLFATEEMAFFGVLQAALHLDYVILAKVGVAEVVAAVPHKNKLAYQTAMDNIRAEHFSFLVCDKNTLAILGAIELDEQRYLHGHQRERLQRLEMICKSANLPFLRFELKPAYVMYDVRKQVVAILGQQKPTSVLVEKAVVTGSDSPPVTKLCPKCSGVMLKRKAKNGVHEGKWFWACAIYPSCKGMAPFLD